MRAVERNKQTVYYALLNGAFEVLTVDGDRTGMHAIGYTDPVETAMNVQWALSNAVQEPFGVARPYSITLFTDDTECPITETSILWVGIAPDSSGEAGAVKHNCEVVNIQKSLNGIKYRLRQVE